MKRFIHCNLLLCFKVPFNIWVSLSFTPLFFPIYLLKKTRKQSTYKFQHLSTLSSQNLLVLSNKPVSQNFKEWESRKSIPCALQPCIGREVGGFLCEKQCRWNGDSNIFYLFWFHPTNSVINYIQIFPICELQKL